MYNNDSIKNEKYLPNSPNSMSLTGIEKAVNQMKKSICKIKIGEGSGTGFFCNIPLDNDNLITVLITNNHILEQKNIAPGKKIEISLINHKDEINYNIYINEQRKTYTNKDYDVTIIEIKQNDNIDKDSFLDIDEDILKIAPEDIIEKSVYLLHYPKGVKVNISAGKIKGLIKEKYAILHSCNSNPGSSGGPLIDSNNNKVIGIHRGGSKNDNKEYNVGSFLKEPILQFIKEIKKINNKEKKEMNLQKKKEIFSSRFKNFLDSNFKDLNERIDEKFKDNYEQINSLLNEKFNENI